MLCGLFGIVCLFDQVCAESVLRLTSGFRPTATAAQVALCFAPALCVITLHIIVTHSPKGSAAPTRMEGTTLVT
jgi:hypothetical protein